MTESYYGMKSLMEPEGWPPAMVFNKERTGTKCNQRLDEVDRKKRLDAYQKLAEKGLPLTKEQIESTSEETEVIKRIPHIMS